MAYLIGLAVGVVAGVFQFWLLAKFVTAATSGSFSIKGAALGLFQFFLPVAVLVAVAFARRQELLWAGVGIAAALIIGAVVKLFLHTRKSRGGDPK